MVFFAQSLRYDQKIILGILKHMPACPVGQADRTGMGNFLACLDLEQKSSLMDGHYLNVLPVFMPEKCVLSVVF